MKTTDDKGKDRLIGVFLLTAGILMIAGGFISIRLLGEYLQRELTALQKFPLYGIAVFDLIYVAVDFVNNRNEADEFLNKLRILAWFYAVLQSLTLFRLTYVFERPMTEIGLAVVMLISVISLGVGIIRMVFAMVRLGIGRFPEHYD